MMFKKLCIPMIFSNLVVIKSLKSNHRMQNLYTNFVKNLGVFKQFAQDFIIRKTKCS